MSAEGTLSTIIIDDHPLFRKGVTELLNSQEDFKVIGEAASGQEGLKLASKLKPDLILIDLNIKGTDGIQVLRALKDMELESINIILTVSDLEENFLTALKCGADGYLLKDADPEVIIEKLRCAVNGEIVIDDTLTNFLTNSFRNKKAQSPTDLSALSEREKEILQLIVKGMSNKLIGNKLGITEGTVKVHVKNTLRKLNLRSRLEAALWAIEHGLIN